MTNEQISIIPAHFEDRQVPSKPVWIRRNNLTSNPVSVACILDEFSMSSYAPEANFFQLTRENWKAELENGSPSLLFVESAWRGHNGTWWNAVQRCGPELRGILDWCNERNIPTAFWNKEDPVHFATFIDTASSFDFVFTTDVDCIPRYRATLNHDRVYFLPFAAQPLFHNPLEVFHRVEGCSFAGAYYLKYEDRNRDFAELVSALKAHGTFDIYDRNFGTENEDQKFPLEFRDNIVGHLLPEDIGIAYKGYTHSLNLNSVKQSQSMFARRVFELFASNTGIISNYSRGLKLLFGDLAITTDGMKSLDEKLKQIELLPNGSDRIRQLGVRKIFREHTYKHRLEQILRQTGVPTTKTAEGKVLLISFVSNSIEVETATKAAARQNYSSINLLLIGEFENLPTTSSVEIFTASSIDEAKILMKHISFSFAGFLDPTSWYGPEYVSDIIDVFSWASVSRVGHAERYVWNGDELLRLDRGTSWTIQTDVPLSRSLVSANAEEFLAKYSFEPSLPTHALAISTLEFCENGADAPQEALENVKSLQMDTGISLSEIQSYGQNLDPSREIFEQGTQNFYSPVYLLGQEHRHKFISFRANNKGELEITSTLPEDKHEYIYNNQLLGTFMLPDKQGGDVYVGSTPGLNVMLAFLFFNDNNERLGQTTLYTGRNNSLTWPEGTTHVRVGLRVRGAGKTTLKTYSKVDQGNYVPMLNLLGDSRSADKVSFRANNKGELEITSTLPEDKHEYIYNNQLLGTFMLPDKQGGEVYVGSTPGLNVMLAFLFFNDNNERLGQTTLYTGRNNPLTWPAGTTHVRVGLRVRGAGKTTLKTYSKVDQGNYVPMLNLLGDSRSADKVSFRANNKGELEITSTLPEGKHEYIYNNQLLGTFMLPDKQGDDVYVGSTPGLDVMLTYIFFGQNSERLGHTTLFTGRNNSLTWPENTTHIRAGLRVRGPGKTILKTYSRSKRYSAAHAPLLKNRSLLVTNQYPSYDSLYKNAFIASRIRRYQHEGFNTEIYCVRDEALELSYREFEGTEILSGSPETLAEVADGGSINKLLIHFLNPKMWNALRDKKIPGGVTVWVHGYEAQPWWRREVLFETPQSKERAASESEKKMSFWHDVLLNAPSNWHFVFRFRLASSDIL